MDEEKNSRVNADSPINSDDEEDVTERSINEYKHT
jgi:hypothetical protein